MNKQKVPIVRVILYIQKRESNNSCIQMITFNAHVNQEEGKKT